MKKDKTKTTGYYLWYIMITIALSIVLFVASKSIYDRWFSENAIDAMQYNEMINYQQLQCKNVYSDGESIVIRTDKIVLE